MSGLWRVKAKKAMKNKSSIVFFSLALFVIISWLLVEFILFSEQGADVGKSCRFVHEGKNKFLKDKKLLAISDQMLWTYDITTEKVMRFRSSSDLGFLNEVIDSGIEFRCQAPGYHCFAQVRDGGFERLNPFIFQNDVFMVEGSRGNQKSVYPVAWRDQKIQLGSPLKFCNHSPQAESTLYSVNGDRIFYFDEEHSLLGVWLLQGFDGATSKSAPREPDQIFGVKEGVGFEISNCDQANNKTKVKSSVQFIGDNIILINDGSRNVETRSYKLDTSLSSVGEPSFLVKKGVTQLKGSLSLVKIHKYKEDSLLLAQSRYFFAPLNLSLIKEDRVYRFPRFSWELRRSELPLFLSTEVNQESGWLFLQESKGISAREFSCPR